MNLKILKKDLFKKKSINLILLMFVMLATVFVASGVTNMLKVMNALDDYMEMSGLADYIIISQNNTEVDIQNNKNIEEFLNNEKSVDGFKVEDTCMISKRNIEMKDGSAIDFTGTTLINSFKSEQLKYFDANDNEIAKMNDGEIYLHKKVFSDNDFKVGDKVRLFSDGGYSKEFTVKGYVKDVLTGGEMMGTFRFIVSENDFLQMYDEAEFVKANIYSIDLNDTKAFKDASNKKDLKILFPAEKSLIKTTYIMNLLISILILVVSICLIIISAVMLRFTMLFTINEEYKSIGILKAIGIKDSAIRKIYITKYFAISVVGAIIGFFLSIPFGDLLLNQMSESIVIKKDDNSFVLQLVLSVVVILLVTLFTYVSTSKIKKLTPLDAIRSGNNGERFNKKGVFRLKNKRMRTTSFLAINDVLSEIKKYMVLMIAAIIGIWLLVIPVNTVNTLRSDKIATWMGMAECDVVIDEFIIDELLSKGSKEYFVEYVEKNKKKLNDNGIKTDSVFMEATYKYNIRCNDKSFKSLALQGIGSSTDWYMYDEGTAPKYDNEVAITHVVAEEIGAKIGDTVYITLFNEEKPFVVTALYQSMNNLGEGIRFTESATLDSGSIAGAFALQVDLYGEPNEDEVKEIKKQIKSIYGNADIFLLNEYIDSVIGGIADTLEPMKILILIMVTIVNMLIIVLMQKMFLIRERGQIGMLKSIGFSNAKVIKWQTKRIVLVLLTGIVVGTLTSTLITELTSGQVFKMMGASKIQFVINPMEVYVIYPVMIFVASVIACIISMQSVRKIDVKDVNNVE